MDVRGASANSQDSELNMKIPLDEHLILQSTEDLTRVFTPSKRTFHTNSHIHNGESPGFSDNPVCPLNSAPPIQMILSFYNVTMKEAPIFATNPAYPLNYAASEDTFPSFCDTAIASTASLPINRAYSSIHMASGQTISSLYKASNAEAPSFLSSPAYPLNYAVSELSTASLYNTVDEEAPILSNEAFSSVHFSEPPTGTFQSSQIAGIIPKSTVHSNDFFIL